jgi:hypothetical protein
MVLKVSLKNLEKKNKTISTFMMKLKPYLFENIISPYSSTYILDVHMVKPAPAVQFVDLVVVLVFRANICPKGLTIVLKKEWKWPPKNWIV